MAVPAKTCRSRVRVGTRSQSEATSSTRTGNKGRIYAGSFDPDALKIKVQTFVALAQTADALRSEAESSRAAHVEAASRSQELSAELMERAVRKGDKFVEGRAGDLVPPALDRVNRTRGPFKTPEDLLNGAGKRRGSKSGKGER